MAYSEQTRAEALLAVELNNGNVLQTATQLGIPESTLRGWVEDAASAKTRENVSDMVEVSTTLIANTREDLIGKLKVLRDSTLIQYEETLPDLKGREAVTALIDLTKLIELLEGNATQRVEAVWNGESVGEAIERYKQEFESRISSAPVLEVESSRTGNSESEPVTTEG
jgi:transposase-like protein